MTTSPAPAPFVLQLEGISIDYRLHNGSRLRAVDDANLSVVRNERIAIVGASGCGKSTILSAVAGFVPVAAGTISRNGGNRDLRPAMDRIMILQDYNQNLPWRTVEGNIAWAIRRRWPDMPRSEAQARARRFTTLVGLERHKDTYPNFLSGGQRQRVAIARSFAVDPEMLLLDEPFAALDAITRTSMQEELNRIWKQSKTTILFVTHDVEEAVRIGDRIVVMSSHPGRIVATYENDATDRPSTDKGFQKVVAQVKARLGELAAEQTRAHA